jgi:hypothetical protein
MIVSALALIVRSRLFGSLARKAERKDTSYRQHVETGTAACKKPVPSNNDDETTTLRGEPSAFYSLGAARHGQ